MATDDERRRVAERLRKAIGLTEFAEALGFNWTDDSDWGWKDVSNLVADLIEPSESGQNRDRNQDTVQKESPAVQMAPECDRDALLALADEMDAYSIQFGTGLQACTIQAWAFSIRESLGVSK